MTITDFYQLNNSNVKIHHSYSQKYQWFPITLMDFGKILIIYHNDVSILI